MLTSRSRKGAPQSRSRNPVPTITRCVGKPIWLNSGSVLPSHSRLEFLPFTVANELSGEPPSDKRARLLQNRAKWVQCFAPRVESARFLCLGPLARSQCAYMNRDRNFRVWARRIGYEIDFSAQVPTIRKHLVQGGTAQCRVLGPF